MARKRLKVSGRMLFTCLLLAGLILLLSPQKITNKLQLGFARIFRLPLSFSRSLMLSAGIYQKLDEQDTHSRTQAQNHIANLQAQLDSQIQENARLRSFLKEHPLLNAKFIYCDILQTTSSELTINCGSSQGLSQGQFVLGDNSIIGAIAQVWSQSAKVTLITSPSSRIVAKIGDKDAIIQGSRTNEIKAPLLVRKSYDIKAGDPVYCQPRSGFLTTQIIIGKVRECKTDPANPLLWDVTIAPACDIKSLSSVDVIVLNK